MRRRIEPINGAFEILDLAQAAVEHRAFRDDLGS
jgi:hypothetical protein